jgi:hypothetical protein
MVSAFKPSSNIAEKGVIPVLTSQISMPYEAAFDATPFTFDLTLTESKMNGCNFAVWRY